MPIIDYIINEIKSDLLLDVWKHVTVSGLQEKTKASQIHSCIEVNTDEIKTAKTLPSLVLLKARFLKMPLG